MLHRQKKKVICRGIWIVAAKSHCWDDVHRTSNSLAVFPRWIALAWLVCSYAKKMLRCHYSSLSRFFLKKLSSLVVVCKSNLSKTRIKCLFASYYCLPILTSLLCQWFFCSVQPPEQGGSITLCGPFQPYPFCGMFESPCGTICNPQHLAKAHLKCFWDGAGLTSFDPVKC